MQAIIFTFIFFLHLLLPFIESATVRCQLYEKDPWSYQGHTNGPSSWGETFPNCYGHNQSPVAIHTDAVRLNKNLRRLSLKNYDRPISKANIINIGHSVQVRPQDGVIRTIEVERSTYTLDQLHFHWGSQYYEGSEHTLDGDRYALEAHFVHKNSANQLAVVGVLFQSTSKNNSAFQPIADVLPNVPFRDDSTELKSQLNLSNLLPHNPASFYRYSGSLTTPGCDEGVKWSILKGVQSIGHEQLSELRSLYLAKENQKYAGCRIVDNFRPLQPLNGRIISESL